MSTSSGGASSSPGRRFATARVIIVSTVALTFISYWRTAAVVLCDLASTIYYIGGIVENAIGPAAPWFILAVMLFSYAVRSVYIESCSLFVRGGVYKVVKEAMGGFLAKLSVSALMFDYVLTGPTSGVSAGQYIMGLALKFISMTSPETYKALHFDQQDPGEVGELVVRWGSVFLAVLVTLYFFRQNLLGIHESSSKALIIMAFTTVMAVVMIGWCLVTLVMRGPAQDVPFRPDLNVKVEHAEIPASLASDPSRFIPDEETVWIGDPQRLDRLKPRLDDSGNPIQRENEAVKEIALVTGWNIRKPEDPLGFLGYFESLNFLRTVGVFGFLLAFAHSILAMSGEETLAQVYREVEAPKMKNFKRAAFIVFVYSVVLTAGVSFLAVLIIPDEVRMKFYSGNLLSGLARHVAGPSLARLILEFFVVVVGFLILAGAVNTALIGSNGVLNRIAEDGVLPDWFLKPHPRYGTTYRLLLLITALQIAVIVLSMGHMIVLGEAYAFGVVWSFVFKALAMVVLRFKDRTPREFKVPLNPRIAGIEVPVGLILIFLVLFLTAILNFFTKEVATVGGVIFTAAFLTVFMVSEHQHEKRLAGRRHEHVDQFNRQSAEDVNPAALELTKPYRKLVAIRSPHNLYMLEKALDETDPDTTDVVVMTAKVAPVGDVSTQVPALDDYDQHLMTAVVQKAEKAGKEVKPLILPTNNPLFAIMRTAKDIGAQEVIVGASNKYTAQEQLDQMAFYWTTMNEQEAPLTIRILGRNWDVHSDLSGGNRIPRISERKARSLAELRAAGVGVDRVLLVHSDTPEGHDLFEAVLTMLDPQVALTVAEVPRNGAAAPVRWPEGSEARGAVEGTLANGAGSSVLQADLRRAAQLRREVDTHLLSQDFAPEIVHLARDQKFDLIILPMPSDRSADEATTADAAIHYIVRHAPCRVFLTAPPNVPEEPEA